MSVTTLTPRVGTIDGIRREETDQFHQLVDHLVADGDDRARAAGRRARRTLTEMAPGYTRQPVLHLTRPLSFRAADDACVLCGRWNCDGTCYAPAPTSAVQRNSVVGAAR
ncbi:hypothetical protein [Streptomyces sp. NBC_01643]|uniref:hypothetical protein n=1 Tax=Streptomyces sp. NBC_01643 TaxID=2975906 RepID=UPI002F916D92|nr:hypothetical protein OHB03_49105 [Streptomyces sp. NBC_01643]